MSDKTESTMEKPEKADGTAERAPDRRGPSRTAQAKVAVATIRTYVARLVWLVCVLAALALAVGALLIAVKANGENDLVKGILNLADVADVGLFDLTNPIKTFEGSDALIKTALLNYGLGALAWLVVGRILTWAIRPRS